MCSSDLAVEACDALETRDDVREVRTEHAAVPVEIVKGGVGRTLEPALSRHERTAFENGLR